MPLTPPAGACYPGRTPGSRCLLPLIVCWVLALMNAGVAGAQSLSIGVKDGLAYRTMWTAERFERDQTAGVGGLSLTARFGPTFGVQPEALLSTERVSGNDGLGIASMDERLLKIPLLLKAYMPLPLKAVLPMAYAGPWAALRLDCTYHDAMGRQQSCGAQGGAGRWGLTWGGGVEFAAGPTDIVLDIRGEMAGQRAQPAATWSDTPMNANACMAFVGVSVPIARRAMKDWQSDVAPARLARLPRTLREPIVAGDRVRARLVTATIQGSVLSSDRDSLVIDTRDPRFPRRLVLAPGMVERVDVSLGRHSPVTPTLVGAAAGAGLSLLFIALQHFSRDQIGVSDFTITRPYVLTAPVVGALVGHAAARERWKEAAFPVQRPEYEP